MKIFAQSDAGDGKKVKNVVKKKTSEKSSSRPKSNQSGIK